MTVSVQSSQSTFLGNGVTASWTFPWVGVSTSDINVYLISSTGQQTLLSSSLYTLTLNAAGAGQLWGVGGTITYPLVGSPIASGVSLLVQRAVPYSQTTNVTNQTAYPLSVQTALDTLAFEIQQMVCRTGQMRGVWASNVQYNFGDIVQDGANGLNTLNFYLCALPNVSSMSWSTDLAAGDWSIAFNVQQLNGLIGAYLPLAGGTIAGNLTVSGITTLNSTTALNGATTAITQGSSDNTTKVATTAFVQSVVSGSASPIVAGTIVPYAGLTAPSGYLFCAGQAVSRVTNSALFAAITISTTCNSHTSTTLDNIASTAGMVAGMPISGTNIAASTTIVTVNANSLVISQAATGSTNGGALVVAPHGVGDGTTTFNLPDLRGRVPIGVDNMNASAANRITTGVSGINGILPGASGGDQNLYAHTHTANVTDGGHVHSVQGNNTTIGGGSFFQYNSGAANTGNFNTQSAATGITVANTNTGTGTSQNVQPGYMINYLIKT